MAVWLAESSTKNQRGCAQPQAPHQIINRSNKRSQNVANRSREWNQCKKQRSTFLAFHEQPTWARPVWACSRSAQFGDRVCIQRALGLCKMACRLLCVKKAKHSFVRVMHSGCMTLIWHLTLTCMQFQIHLVAVHLVGISNQTVDSLSHFNLSRFQWLR